MIYVLETDINENKSIFFSLKSIYGISNTTALLICKKLGFVQNLKVKNLSQKQIEDLINLIETSNIIITNDLKKIKSLTMKNLIFIKSYRGLRKIKGLPVRGQRTHTNGKSSRKNKNLY